MINKAIATYLYEKYKKLGGVNPLLFFLLPILLFVMIPIALFNPGGSGHIDAYAQAYETIGCTNKQDYIVEDIRAFEAYVDPSSYDTISKESALARLHSTYIKVNYEHSDQKVCLLQPDDKIVEALKKQYNISDAQAEDLLMNVEAVRNGRKYFVPPIDGKQVGTFDPDKNRKGILMKGEVNTDVLVMNDGEITNIETINEILPYKNPTCESTCSTPLKKGLTITIKHEVLTNINEDGEYNTEIIYSNISLLKDIVLNVGDKVKQGDVIAHTKDNTVYLELMNEKNEYLDPVNYIIMERQVNNLQLPFELPIRITSEVGGRELGGMDYHYGLDMTKDVDAPIHILADGEIVSTNSTCAPYGGMLGSKCPQMHPLTGAGNYVMIKFEHQEETYYATYMHMALIDVHEGDIVNAGDIIGTQGHSGNSTASHLHLEIHKGTRKIGIKEGLINPKDMLNFEEIE